MFLNFFRNIYGIITVIEITLIHGFLISYVTILYFGQYFYIISKRVAEGKALSGV